MNQAIVSALSMEAILVSLPKYLCITMQRNLLLYVEQKFFVILSGLCPSVRGKVLAEVEVNSLIESLQFPSFKDSSDLFVF